MKSRLIFLDVEATGKDAQDRLIQLAYKVNDDNTTVVNELYSTDVKIKLEAMAVHHITEKMLEGKPKFKDSKEYKDLENRFTNGEIFVAHNAPFDISMIEKEGLKVKRYIDTLKIARFLDSEGKIPSYKLQYLRYYLNMEIEAAAHDALGDILVLEKLFYYQLEEIMKQENLSQDTAIDKMVDISNDPIILKFFPFGKHKNKSVEEVAKEDPGYLKWLLEQKKAEEIQDIDWIATLEHYLK